MVILSLHICNGNFVPDDDTHKLVLVSINNSLLQSINIFINVSGINITYFQPISIRPNSSLEDLHPDYATTWIKMLSCWVCAGLYVWTLVAPIILPEREF